LKAGVHAYLQESLMRLAPLISCVPPAAATLRSGTRIEPRVARNGTSSTFTTHESVAVHL